MKTLCIAGVLAALALVVPQAQCLAGCTLVRLAELPVTMAGLQPTVPVQLNGAPTRLIADSGAFYSILSPGSATELGLRLAPAPFGLTIGGIGGQATVSVTTVSRFTLAGATLRNVQFIVGGSGLGGQTAGVLGQNVLHIADVEYDLADGVIRLMRPRGCGDAPLAYWAGSQPVSVMELEASSAQQPQTVGTALLDGARLRVLFDTGSPLSVLTLRAAARAGVRPGGAGVVPAGLILGVGRRTVRTWTGPFDSFQIGQEQIRHTQLRLADIDLNGVDMLIGADFFLSHHIYVANGQRRVYFTYNGGAVFRLPAATAGAPSPAGVAPAPGVTGSAQSTAPPGSADQQPLDAAALSRRGMALAARHDYAAALQDLTRACELSPSDPDYLDERGQVREAAGQAVLAEGDFARALQLRPTDVQALMARATLSLGQHSLSSAAADLDAASRAVPAQDDVRLPLAADYLRAGLPLRAITQYSLWIGAHGEDARMASALAGRCWARALAGVDLRQAQSDCDRALRMNPDYAPVRSSRGLVRLRLGELARSREDYDAALRAQPGNAWSLYGRGMDELRQGLTAAGRQDIAAALARAPGIAVEARGYGISP